ncbi:alpha/beta hydrolase [Nocardioides montaniterrae]
MVLGGEASVRARVIGLGLRATVRPVIAAWTAAPGLPWPYAVADYAGIAQHKVRGTQFRRTSLGGVPTQEVLPKSRTDERTILYFHGGAFVVGGWHLHRALLSRIAAQTGARILAVDYRQLPTHPVSVSVDDCAAAYEAILEEVAPEDLVVMGDSAGGFLTFTTLARAGRAGLPMPAAAAALSPLTDMRHGAVETYAGCALFGPGAIPAFRQFAAEREIKPSYAHPSDVRAPLLPPILIQAATHEALYPDIERFAQDLVAGGAPVELHTWPLDIHVFHAAALLPEAQQAVTALAAFCDEAWVSAAVGVHATITA